MGAAASRLSKPLKNWNIENRAHKAISQPKPRPAPTYESTQKQIQLADQVDPGYKEAAQKKNLQLDQHLKNVFVSSNIAEVVEIDSRSNPDRPLPKQKALPEEFEYGFYEPNEIKVGKVSLRQALEFIGKNSKDPEKYSTEFIATEYNLEPILVANILEYYKLYEVRETLDNYDKDAIARPLRISLKSGITVPHTEKKKKSEPIDEGDEKPQRIQRYPQIENK